MTGMDIPVIGSGSKQISDNVSIDRKESLPSTCIMSSLNGRGEELTPPFISFPDALMNWIQLNSCASDICDNVEEDYS